ncbi:phospholipase C [Burkholderia pseudomallei MSHR338]|uniref:phosphocholine-specific phospholipase C n=1 Tax=Burkholderia pseudomallei TaxID=28450 RepID=UPI00016B1F3B|nr:phospholipase C, phosphocholine-specific [Burkholderia pseudomallei]KGX79381.1 phospholipase C, phosphocholine-specific [Burkholderia pseudomallei MSHR435]ACQ98072.1 phospholipase C, phosphocholine-specific [Burkholderia pseudomallei MSHR346]AGZ28891.1 phospholipase C, phosphocholine-specific [Burkholderia pseudomallei NCTC 13179]AIP10624.1 phospholipase C, phosphocholine-specific [Burkholderia pseudomallei]AJX23487.1 phospholipase C, phosphocholine-specific [Burkholderia pseudomallei MSHR4
MTSESRRRFLHTIAQSAGAAAALTVFPESIRRALAIPAASRTGTLRDVEHIVVFMQENRSFDHYFGHLRGVRGYNDRFPIPLPNGKPVWYQPSKANPGKPVLPFRLNTLTTSAQCIGDLDHSWYKTHAAIDGGRYDQWPANKTDMTMGYHVREDIPFHYALADAFTVCDNYFCSLPGPTHPNRSYLMTGTVDPTGRYGGPLLDNSDYVDGDVPPKYDLLTWTTYPERLEANGISWQIYQQGTAGADPLNGNYGTNILQNFANFINAKPGSSLYRRAQTARTLDDLKADVLANKLPQVSWLLPPAAFSEHPRYTPAYGANYTSQILDALTSNPDVWRKTVLFIMYDENDGFFDHVVPPQPATTRAQGLSTVTVDGEIHDVVNPGRGGSYTADGLPYGLGPRVPMTVVSPWTKGGFVCSQVFDHTSVIRFIAARFGIDEPNITPWRRAVCGDLTSAFDFRTPDATLPPLPDTSGYRSIADQLCSTKPAPAVPAAPSPVDPQEPGVRPARALPYELHVNAEVHGGARLRIEFANRGEQGAHFYVYASNRSDGPWRYTVGAHRSLHETFDLAATNGAYAFAVYGPNGFVRVFEGLAAAGGHGRQAAARPEVKAGYDVANGNLYLKLANHGAQSVQLTLADNAYGAPARRITLRGGDEQIESWALASSHQWYDVTVSDGATGQFVRRFAGHVENGKPSYSDPAAIAPVTG